LDSGDRGGGGGGGKGGANNGDATKAGSLTFSGDIESSVSASGAGLEDGLVGSSKLKVTDSVIFASFS
jgi:hypothetical protein